MSYTSSEARSKEQLLKIFEVIEGAKEKFSRGKNGKEVVSKLTSTTSDTLKRKVDEAFELTRDEQNSKIVKKIIGLPMEIWMALLEADGDMNLWFQLVIKAEKNIEYKESIYSEKVISKVKFIVNDVSLSKLIAKLGDSLKYVKHLTISGGKWTLQQYFDAYQSFNVNYDALKTTQLENLTLLKCSYFYNHLDVKFTSGLKKLVIIGNSNFTVDYYKRGGVTQENQIIYDGKKVKWREFTDFYNTDETSIGCEIFYNGKLTELFIQDVRINYRHIVKSEDYDAKKFFVQKATFINAYPSLNPLKVNELIIKKNNRYTVEGLHINTFYADHCYLYKCEIAPDRIGLYGKKKFEIPACRILFIDNSLLDVDYKSVCLLYSENNYVKTDTIYINNTITHGFKLSYQTLKHLNFISFDMNDDGGYTEAIAYCNSNQITVKHHSDEEFKLLINNTFK
jgi:hypothetical protein